jgi:hypothetical protein
MEPKGKGLSINPLVLIFFKLYLEVKWVEDKIIVFIYTARIGLFELTPCMY